MSIEKYKVNDLIPDSNLKVLFVFESPFKQEVINKCPVAGSSGKSVSKFLNRIDDTIPSKTPFGIYLKNSKDERFGIANCSNIPLDKNVYQDENCIPFDKEKLNKIREKLSAKGNINDSLKEAHHELQRDFVKRMEKIYRKADCLTVLCGKFAYNFYRDAGFDINEQILTVPHPSRNQWFYKKFENTMNLLHNKLVSLLNVPQQSLF